MSEGSVRHCPGCGQILRFPADVGGVLMACPVCGRRFASPFRLAAPAPACRPAPAPTAPAVAGAEPAQAPAPEPQPKSAAPSSQAARVAALYASKS